MLLSLEEYPLEKSTTTIASVATQPTKPSNTPIKFPCLNAT